MNNLSSTSKLEYDRFPSKINSLNHLKQFLNDEIKTVIDVGVLNGTPELIKVFNDCKHVLVEPVDSFHENIIKVYNDHDIEFDLIKKACSNKIGKNELRVFNHMTEDDYPTGSTLITRNEKRENNRAEIQITEVDTTTLDDLCKSYLGPFVIKIDVDGHEFEILKGSGNCLEHTYLFVIEAWTSRIEETIRILSDKGFALWDITDFCYTRAQMSQVDLVFLNKSLFKNSNYKEISPTYFGFKSKDKGSYFRFLEKSIDENQLNVYRKLS